MKESLLSVMMKHTSTLQHTIKHCNTLQHDHEGQFAFRDDEAHKCRAYFSDSIAFRDHEAKVTVLLR